MSSADSSAASSVDSSEELQLDWMDQQGEWGMHATTSKQGLTLADIQMGSYGEAPDFSDNMTG